MIAVKGEIVVIDSGNGILNNNSTGTSKVNIATDIGLLTSNTKDFIDNSFRLGFSKLGDGTTYQKKLDYFEGSIWSDSEGCFADPYIINLYGANITHFTMVFDTEHNVFPVELKVNDIIYYDDDPIQTISGLENLSNITIKISKLNKPNSKLIISKVYLGIKIDINYQNLVSVNCEQKMVMTNNKVDFGIAVNSGRMKLNDSNGEILDYANAGLLLNGRDCVMTLYDSITGKETLLGTYVAQKWNYDAETRSFTVSLENDLLNWQNIVVARKDWQTNSPTSLYSVFEHLKSVTPCDFVPFTTNSGIKQRLENITLDSFTLESGTLWNKWQEFCEASMLYMFYNNNKEIVFELGFGE